MRKSRPGPTGTSCLTCKQRRKKCDRREPICERCEASDFECLGYDHIRPVVPSTARSLRPLLPKRPAKAASQSPSDGASSTEHSTGSSYGNNHQEVPDWEAIAHPLQDAALNLSHAPHPTPEIHTFDQVDTSGGTSAFTRTVDHNFYCSSQLALQATEGSASVFRQIIKLYSQLPKSLSDPFNFLDDQWFIQHIVAQTEGTMGYWYFRPLQKCDSRQQIQLKVSGRLNNTKFTRWIYLAVIGIVRSFLTGDMSHIQLHNSWMDYIQGSLAAELTLDLAPREMQERWSEWLHVSLIKTVFINNLNAYQALRNIAPIFLQVIYSMPTLWPAHSDLARVPLPGILDLPTHQFAYFSLIDCTYAMVSGLPQQVEYDTTIHSPLPSSSRYQITHGFPNELLLMLADINACRDMSPHARRWEHIEHQLLTWQSRHGEYAFAESWMTVAWYAVQESWRLALLIYLYLAVCGASSDEARIQSRAKQIMQVAGTVKKRGRSDANISFCNQYLMVGICARSETDRKIIQDKLVSASEVRLWIVQPSDSALVLEHLWNGAGAGGRPVVWDDYVRSREAVLPIVTHKKCDQQQPVCERCEAGGFECLGYGHNKRAAVRTTEVGPGSSPISGVLEGGDSSSRLSGSNVDKQASGSSLPLEAGLVASFRSLIGENVGALQDVAVSSTESTASSNFDSEQPPKTVCTSVSRTSQPYQVEDYLRLFAARPTHEAPVGPTALLRKITVLQAQLPYLSLDPLKTFLNCTWCVDYLLEQSDKHMDRWYLKPLNYTKKRAHKDVVLRLQNSVFSRWIILVAMCVSESFRMGDMSQDTSSNFWIGCIENSLGNELAQELGPRRTQDRLIDWIHVSILKAMITPNSNVHRLLRDNVATFLQLLFSYPTLWPADSEFTNIPLSNLLCSEAHEAAYFALVDCVYAMASGLPQQLNYDTTMHQRPSAASLYQWIHGCPTEFQLILADINACRDRFPMARDKKEIENWLLTWQPHPSDYIFAESWMTVTWYAVQESWRLSLLVYLYLAVCGVSSNDQRIQLYIRQITQVVGAVKKRGSSGKHICFFIQYLMVGICARNETHRKIARDKLLAPSESKLWLIRTADFVPVLDHLWHGTAANGNPIKWSDYMRSREAVLPIMI
ncbi:hypothetical protein RHS04_00148 [Rhizoctonia solani]|uniref:Zn(2)-C6 fungal-type domain-containing protein n=1 Tax=Rhizoctonia solani TaxID=456999 RepID=A0A8H7LP86_9AGAM|nr:hypothetical protein RHS04_00148 [Rhizoctonia solani]